MNVKTSPLIIKDSEAELILNYNLDKIGALTKRAGTFPYASKLTGGLSATFSGAVDWQYEEMAIHPSGVTAPVVNGTVSHDTSPSGSSTSWSMGHTVGSGLVDSLLVVVVSNAQFGAPTLVTYNGVSMTKAVGGATNFFVQIWYLVNPPAGLHTVSAFWAVSVPERSLIAMTVTGANQTSPLDAIGDNSGFSTVATVSAPTMTNSSLLVGALMSQNTTQTLGQVQQALVTTTSNSFKLTLGTSVGIDKTIDGLYQFYEDSGTTLEQLTVANNASDSSGIIYYNNAGVWTPGKSDDAPSRKTRFSTFINHVFRVNGANVVASSTNGISWGTADSPATITPNFTAVFQDRVYVANGVSSNLSRLWYSSLPNAGVITWDLTNDWIDINPDDGDQITGLENNGNRLLIFKNRSMYRWTFGQVEPDRLIGVGTQSQESIKTNFDVGVTFFANQFGVYAYTSGRPKLISRKIQAYVDAVADWSNVFAEVDDDHYYLAVGDLTVGGRAFTNTMFVYTVSLSAWVIYTTAVKVTWMARLAETYAGVETIRFGSNDGQVYTFLTGQGDYVNSQSVSIPCEFRSKEYLLSFPFRTNLSWVDMFSQQAVAAVVFYDLDRSNQFIELGAMTRRVNNFRVPTRECNSVRVKWADNSKNTSVVEGFNLDHTPKDKRDENPGNIQRSMNTQNG